MENFRSAQDHRSAFRAIVITSSDMLPDAQQELRMSAESAALVDPALKYASITRSRKAARSLSRKSPEVISPR
jgi:hypothetical protein